MYSSTICAVCAFVQNCYILYTHHDLFCRVYISVCSGLVNNEASSAALAYYPYSRASLINGKGARYVFTNTTVITAFHLCLTGQFLPCDASAERVDATVSRLSVSLSITIGYHVQIRSNSSKIISRPDSLRCMCSLTPNIGDLVQREHPQN